MKTLTITQPQSYQLRSVLNLALKNGDAHINGVKATSTSDGFEIQINDKTTKEK